MREETVHGLMRMVHPVFSDERGRMQTLCEGVSFRESATSRCVAHVLKGIHGDHTNWKLLSCVRGEILHVAVDILRMEWTPTFLRPEGGSVLLAPGVGSAVYFVEDSTLLYQQSQGYLGADKQFTYRWDDPVFGIAWPEGEKILSDRDRMAGLL